MTGISIICIFSYKGWKNLTQYWNFNIIKPPSCLHRPLATLTQKSSFNIKQMFLSSLLCQHRTTNFWVVSLYSLKYKYKKNCQQAENLQEFKCYDFSDILIGINKDVSMQKTNPRHLTQFNADVEENTI
jgi:hypothetical protein